VQKKPQARNKRNIHIVYSYRTSGDSLGQNGTH
jgi:hypothetical protein